VSKLDDIDRGVGSISGALTGPEVPPPRRRSDPVRTTVRTIGEVLITLGVVVLLFVVYEVYVTDLISAGKQRDATAALDDQWKIPDKKEEAEDPQKRVDHFDGLKDGEGFAKMYIPTFGSDYHFTIVEGTSEKALEIGPGHYTDTAYPGTPGNFAVAGHRVGKGAPFNDIDLVKPCDAIIVETKNNWYIYRMLPLAKQKADWPNVKAQNRKCANVNVLGAPFEKVVGQSIVSPDQGSVIASVPGDADAKVNVGSQVSLMTLTTCHPKFSDKQRLIVHAVMDRQQPKDPNNPGLIPPEMKET
jgi:sortase A